MGARPGGAGGPGPGAGDFSSAFSDVFEDLFGEFMGGAAGARGRRPGGANAKRGADMRYNLAISLEELMGDINQREREASPSRTNCDPKIIDFSDARLRRLQAARDDTGVRDTDPSRTTGA